MQLTNSSVLEYSMESKFWPILMQATCLYIIVGNDTKFMYLGFAYAPKCLKFDLKSKSSSGCNVKGPPC